MGLTAPFSTADTINGNDRTILQVVADANGAADYVEMSGVNQLKVVGAGATC